MPSMPKPQKASDASRRKNRSYGQRSPIDKALSEDARHELRRMLQTKKTLREIQAWLKAAHGCVISQQGVSAWWLRRQADENAEIRASHGTPIAKGRSESFEIIVRAPGASEICVEIRPLAICAKLNH